MILDRLYPSPGAKKRRKRRGRGHSSGHGKTSCRGNKGLLSRSGGGLRHGFEGGQMPLIRRIPKRGFSGPKRHIYQIVNLAYLNKIKENDIISPGVLKDYGLIKDESRPIKILGDGELSKPITISAHAFSRSAIEKIKKAGGKAEIIKNVTGISKSI